MTTYVITVRGVVPVDIKIRIAHAHMKALTCVQMRSGKRPLKTVQQATKKRATSEIGIRRRYADHPDQGGHLKTLGPGDNRDHTNKEATGLSLQAVPVASPLTVHSDTGETRV